jgi:hypothetical protein
MHTFQHLPKALYRDFHTDYTVIFTGRSVMNRLAGCVFILNGNAFEFQLYSFSSVFAADLRILYKALEAVDNLSPGKFGRKPRCTVP